MILETTENTEKLFLSFTIRKSFHGCILLMVYIVKKHYQ